MKISSVDFYQEVAEKNTGNRPFSGLFKKPRLGVAIDIGTTTIAFELLNLRTGEKIAAHSRANGQRAFGCDIIMRISRANDGDLNALYESIVQDLRAGIEEIAAQADVSKAEIRRAAICGNTTMLHFLQKFSCETLGVFPFAPVSVEMRKKIFFKEIIDCEIAILPAFSAFIGADIIAGIFHCGGAAGNNLLIDLGTNGEMALICADKILVCSAATGPAFESVPSVPGAIAKANFSPEDGVFTYETIGKNPPVGICGTGVIDICAEIIRHGLADETGLLHDSVKIADEPPIFFTQKDIRDVQLAKSAIRAGLEILLFEAGFSYENIQRVFLAGGFGYKMNAENAAEIGLIPAPLKAKIKPVGNAALGGCAKFLLGREDEIKKIPAKIKEINLAAHPKFEKIFLQHINF